MLSERQKLILSAVVDNYIQSAEPIGSRSIAKRNDIGFSPATIRNEMADLEEMGFLIQPHTSAGRIPSNKGYRYYVDHLINPQGIKISKDVLNNIRKIFTEQFNEFEQVIEQTATILSEITNYTSIILGPEIFNTKLKHIQIIPLADNSIIVILVTNTGKVEHKTLTIPKGVSSDEIERLVNFLNSKLVGVPLYQLKSKIKSEIYQEFITNFNNYERSMAIIDQLFIDLDQDSDNKVYVGGATNILNQPEFNDLEIIKDIFSLFERTDEVKQLIKPNNKGIEVRIGTENNLETASNCSVITATYEVDGESIGTIGIFGPTRMNYSRVIRILEYLADDFTQFFTRLYK
ncbi:heat-inducible transcriptional repressor HrcA [Vulcanibacillus modesticaldus]|uniref:Heat-inducible transcription repressor HrcA n=1 Tax=Vulcanibacillus modesticaldus TaxID=337097 RepID=A0A1D2YSE2_9BACI|nr:heat-inducible transcriptional repressor HrcA [Vulcanibacillus modesticaldus]OEF96937.1 heat-inducible transcriptional repressor HrcA [Vulcanibacillus modesticaldus]